MLRRFQVSVEGNVGIGKSCFIARLGADLEKLGRKVHIAPEPIEQWTNWEGKYNLLGMQYTTPKAFAMPFQLAACISKCEQLLDTPPRIEILLTERSLDSQLKVFLPALIKDNSITDLDVTILHRLFTLEKRDARLRPDLFIYLRADPEVALTRTCLRKRPEEEGVQLQLLQGLHEIHDKWLVDEQECLVVDATGLPDSLTVAREVLQYYHQFMLFSGIGI